MLCLLLVRCRPNELGLQAKLVRPTALPRSNFASFDTNRSADEALANVSLAGSASSTERKDAVAEFSIERLNFSIIELEINGDA